MHLPGSIIAGRYRVYQRLGAGGMATVWLADDQLLRRSVAIKVISGAYAEDTEWREQFDREARAAASLAHPNIVAIYDIGSEADRPYLVMEYVDGVSLATALDDGHRCLEARLLARELLAAVGCVHAAGIIHRDVTPANVLLDATGHPHLSDFGLAQRADAAALTQTGLVVGTSGFLAPEVAQGGPATIASDLYAVGRTLERVEATAWRGGLGHLVAALTEPDPARRPASAEEALHRLDRLGATRGASATTTVMAPRRHNAARADRWLHARGVRPAHAVALAALALIVLAAVLAAARPGHDRTIATTPSVGVTAPLGEQLVGLDRAIRAARAGR